MSLFTIVEEHPNFVIFDDLIGQRFVYERLTSQILDPELASTKAFIKKLRTETIPVNFGVSPTLVERLDEPVQHLEYDLTWRCQAECGYCPFVPNNYHGSRTHQQVSMDEELAIEAFWKFAPMAAPNPVIGFYGGEPLLEQPLIEKIIKLAKSQFENPRFSMTSNMILAKKHAQFIVDNSIILSASMDGPWTDEYRKTAGGIGLFKFVEEGITAILELDPNMRNRIGFSAVITHPEKFSELREFFASTYQNMRLDMASVDQRGLINLSLKPSPGQVQAYTQQYKKMALEYLDAVSKGEPVDMFLSSLFVPKIEKIAKRPVGYIPLQLEPLGICTPGKKRMFVRMDGKYGVCEKVGYDISVGSVQEGYSHEQAINAMQIMADIRQDTCTDCYVARICESCWMHASDGSQVSTEGFEQYCDRLKNNTLEKLSLFTALARSASSEAIQKHLSNYVLV
jgi:uncharacterized protein